MTFEQRALYAEQKPRETRAFDTTFTVGGVGIEVRGAESGDGLVVEGYASVTNAPYGVTDALGEYTETISRGAFRRSLSNRDDVRLLVNHEGVPIARTKSGTLELREDDHGLKIKANLDGDSPLVKTVRSAMDRGDLDEMSFSFQATQQDWNKDYTQRTIREAKLFDVSIVTYPANPATSIQFADVAREAGDDTETAVPADLTLLRLRAQSLDVA